MDIRRITPDTSKLYRDPTIKRKRGGMLPLIPDDVARIIKALDLWNPLSFEQLIARKGIENVNLDTSLWPYQTDSLTKGGRNSVWPPSL